MWGALPGATRERVRAAVDALVADDLIAGLAVSEAERRSGS